MIVLLDLFFLLSSKSDVPFFSSFLIVIHFGVFLESFALCGEGRGMNHQQMKIIIKPVQ